MVPVVHLIIGSSYIQIVAASGGVLGYAVDLGAQGFSVTSNLKLATVVSQPVYTGTAVQFTQLIATNLIGDADNKINGSILCAYIMPGLGSGLVSLFESSGFVAKCSPSKLPFLFL